MKSKNWAVNKFEDKLNIEAGMALIAKPFWNEPEYNRSVIYLLAHNDDEGSIGIILNKRSNLFLNSAFPDISIQMNIGFGGPIKPENLSFLHTNNSIPDSISIRDGIYFMGDDDLVMEMIENKKILPQEIKFFSGLVRWEPKQLKSELDSDKWWLSHTNPRVIFNIESDDLWGYHLADAKNLYSMFDDIPDPSLN